MKTKVFLLSTGLLVLAALLSGCASFDTLDPLAPQNEQYVLNE